LYCRQQLTKKWMYVMARV